MVRFLVEVTRGVGSEAASKPMYRTFVMMNGDQG